MLLTEKKLLSDCGNCLVIDDGNGDPNERYDIKINQGSFLIIEVGSFVNKPVSKFNHPNIIASRKEVYEFKHYRRGGGKFWTSKAGISHYFIIPTNKIYILPEKGYSYIRAEINGVKVHFNVSGGGGSGGWSDYLGHIGSISVNHKLSDVKKIAEVAVRDTETIKMILEKLDAKDKDSVFDRTNELARWEKMVESSSPSLKNDKEKLLKMIQDNITVTICLKDGYVQKEGTAEKIYRSGKKHIVSDKVWEWDMSQGRLKYIIVHFEGSFPIRVKDSQVDWLKTLKKNEALLKNEAILNKKVVDNVAAI